jgi:hypothetical protein
MKTDETTGEWDGKLPRFTSQHIVLQVDGTDHTLKMIDPVDVHNARAVLTTQFQDDGGNGKDIAGMYELTYDTALGQFIRHKTYEDVAIPHMQWDPPDVGLHQITAYCLLTTSKDNFKKYMTAEGAAGGAAGVGEGGGGWRRGDGRGGGGRR